MSDPVASFDPHDPAFQADPYPTYALLRERAPLARFDRRGSFYWVSRYDDVAAILRDPRFSAERIPEEMMAPGVPDSFRRLGELLTRMLLVRDPPDHTRLRGLVNKAFTPRVVESLRPRAAAIVAELLDAAIPRGAMDVIRDLATPLPVVVIAELLGVAAADRERFKHWSDDVAVVLDGSIRAAGLPAAASSCAELCEYLRRTLAERRRAPRDDLLSRLLAARERDDALGEDELVATAVLILLAGHETTTNLIGNGVLALGERPEAVERLRRAPELVPAAVEEMLRFDPPVQTTSRAAREAVEISGVRIEPGIEVDLAIAAANRDPAQFRDPERFDLAREPNRHLAFGLGAHFCLGAPLARLEAQVAFAALVRRVPGFKVERAGLQRRPGLVLRGLEALPISF
jgi:hypothetical protein